MSLKYMSKKRFNRSNDLLSTTKPMEFLSLKRNSNNISLEKKSSDKLKLALRLKKILKVYIEPETNQKLVEAVAAHELGITKVRSVLIGSPRYYEITDDMINKLKERDYEIEYITLPKKEKQKIQVFYNDNSFYISSAAAYALGYIDVEKFNYEEQIFGPLKEAELQSIKNNFDVEFVNLKEKEETLKTL